MRIGLFTHVYPPMINGVAISVKNLEQELIRQGHQVFIITNNYDEFKTKKEENRLETASIYIKYQNLRTPIIPNPRLFKKIDDLNLDLIHSHSDFGLGLISRIYSYDSKKPHIQTYHCNYIEYAKNNFGKSSALFFKKPVELYSKYLGYTTDRLVVPSREVYKVLTEDFKIKKNMDIIPNGLDLKQFKDVNKEETKRIKQIYNIKDNDFVILSLSRLSKEKRIDEIIKIMPKLQEYPNIKLLIVGQGPDEERLKKIARFCKNIIFTGEVPNEKVKNYYKVGTVFVTNSIAETQGLTLVESLASNLPVLCINNALYEDVIKDGENGITFNNCDELTEIIKNLYDKRENLEKLKKNSSLNLEKYSVETQAKQLLDVYEEEIFKKNRNKVRIRK